MNIQNDICGYCSTVGRLSTEIERLSYLKRDITSMNNAFDYINAKLDFLADAAYLENGCPKVAYVSAIFV